jgi:hypothetical protein
MKSSGGNESLWYHGLWIDFDVREGIGVVGVWMDIVPAMGNKLLVTCIRGGSCASTVLPTYHHYSVSIDASVR